MRVSRETFESFFTAWLQRRAPYLEAGTLADYESHGRKRLIPAFGGRRLAAIDGPAVEQWLSDAARSGICKQDPVAASMTELSTQPPDTAPRHLPELETAPHLTLQWLRDAVNR